MTCSYSGNPGSTEKDAVRFLCQDVDTNRQLSTDEEIAWTLTQEMNVYMAAARVCDVLVGKAADVKLERVGDLSLEYDSERLTKLAAAPRARGMNYSAPTAGGFSKAELEAILQDSDLVQPMFSEGMHDNKFAGAGGTQADQK